MNKGLIIIIASFLFLMSVPGFSQFKNEVIVTGTVYISSSVSPGVMNGQTMKEGPHLFRKQPIYFKNDSITGNVLTDSLGIFSIRLKEGTYIVEQEAALNKKKDGLNHFGQFVITVKKGEGPIKILFENSSNRRSVINSGLPNNGLPGSKATKNTKQK